jgi:hypothetical protein
VKLKRRGKVVARGTASGSGRVSLSARRLRPGRYTLVSGDLRIAVEVD